jgi:hypothetical protein
MGAHVVATFEHAVLQSREAYWSLFDFEAVGIFEKLLRRHDLLGRLPDLSDAAKAQLRRDTPTPYPPAREKRNLGYFYKLLAQRTVGSGGCTAGPPQSEYARKMGLPFAPLPAEHAAWDEMRPRINPLIERGGVIALRCKGGKGGLALVYTRTSSKRGFDIITMYDDVAGY